MYIINNYLGSPYLAIMNAKTDEEKDKCIAIYEARVQEYRDKGLSSEQNPDGTWPEIDENY